MDAPPKLYDLAFEVVVNYYTTGLLPTKVIPPNTTVSDQIFETVMRIRCHCYDDHTKRLMKEFKPTKLELNLEEYKQGSFSEIRKLKLVELKIRDFAQISKYRIRVADPPQRGKQMSSRSMSDHFSLVHFLGDILSKKSKRELRVLDIAERGFYGNNWMEAVSLMFPKLEVLNINGQDFCKEDFATSCSSLPNLTTLFIGHSFIKSINGISKLTNLKNLVIDGSNFVERKDVEGLFELKNLKTLSFSHNFHFEFYFAEAFPELTHLEIQWKEADDDFLRKILPKLPKLQVVVAIDTKIHGNVAPPSVTVYTSTDLNAIMKSLAYFRTTENREQILMTIQKFCQLYPGWNARKTCTLDQLTVCVNEAEALIETFKFDKEIVDDVNSCLDIFTCFATSDEHLNVNKLKIVSLLLKDLKNHLKTRTPPGYSSFKSIWLNIDKFIENTENLNIDKIAVLTMESIIYAGGAFQSCVDLLEKMLDKMDLSSEYYEKISFRKLHKCLSEIHKNANLWARSRTSAGKVLKYIEIFM